MHIGEARRILLSGGRVCRAGWNGWGQFLELRDPGDVDAEAMTLPYVALRTVGGNWIPWVCSQLDLLAEDWEVAR